MTTLLDSCNDRLSLDVFKGICIFLFVKSIVNIVTFCSIKLVPVSLLYRDISVVLGLGGFNVPHWTAVAISTTPGFRAILMMDVT